MSFRVAAVCLVAFSAGSFIGFFWVVVPLSPSGTSIFPRSNRTLRTCFRLGGAASGGVVALDTVGDDTADDRDTTRRVSRCGDGDAEDSLRVLFWRLPLDGDGDLLSEGVEVPDPIGVVSSSESVSTNSRDLYLVSRPVSGIESPLLTSSTSAAVAGVPSRRQLCLVIR